MKKIFLTAFILLFVGPVSAQKNTLGFNFTKNQVFTQTMTADINIDQSFAGQTMKINMKMVSKNTFKVLEVHDTDYLVNVTYENLSLKMNMPGMPATGEVDAVMKKMTNAINGKSFSMNMSKKGKIVKIHNMENLFSGLFDSIPEMPEAQKEQMKKQMEDAYGKNNFIANFESYSAIFPSHAVAKGDKWTNKNKMETSFSMLTETEYTLKDVTAKYYLISYNMKMKMDKTDSLKMTNGLPMVFNMDGTGTGELKIDRATGWIISGTLLQKMSGENEVKDCAQVPGGMKIPMVMENKMEISE